MKKIRKNKELKNGRKSLEKRRESEGFTFIETVAVLAIAAVLTAGATASAEKLIANAKKTATRNQIEQYYAALQSYFLDCGMFPTTEQGLYALWEKPVFYPIPEDWDGPYIEREPCADPWGTDFKYLSAESSVMPPEVPENLPFVLISYGADKKEGGTGNGEDIVSWK